MALSENKTVAVSAREGIDEALHFLGRDIMQSSGAISLGLTVEQQKQARTDSPVVH